MASPSPIPRGTLRMAELDERRPTAPLDARRSPASDFSAQERAAINAQLAQPVTTKNVDGEQPVAVAPPGTTIARLLTPTKDDPSEAVVHFGNVAVERPLVADWKAAQQYLAKAPEAVDVLNALETGGTAITVHQISDGNDLFDPSTATIDWDPHSALIATDGSSQTPALALLHEQGHASEFLRDPSRQDRNAGTVNQRYDNAEEQRNIQGLESRVATALGEGLRQDHGGTSFVVKDPASRQATGPALADPAALAQIIHGERFVLTLHGYPNVPPPPSSAKDGIVPWDGAAHTGSIVHIDGDTVAQYVGGGKYQVYDVQKDLHGVVPPENNSAVTISPQGLVQSGPTQTMSLTPDAPGQTPSAAMPGGRG